MKVHRIKICTDSKLLGQATPLVSEIQSKANFISDIKDAHSIITSREFKELQKNTDLPVIDYEKERDLMQYFGITLLYSL